MISKVLSQTFKNCFQIKGLAFYVVIMTFFAFQTKIILVTNNFERLYSSSTCNSL